MSNKRRSFAPTVVEKGVTMDGTDSMADQNFIRLVKERQYQQALDIIDDVKNINVVDKETGATALHLAASRSVVEFIAHLEKRDDLDYLVRDGKGRFPSDMAWAVAHNEELGIELMQKEKQQAARQNKFTPPGIDL